MATTLASLPAIDGRRSGAPQLPDLDIVTHPVGQVYVARHGQTESNLLRRYAGYSSEPLTKTGRSQMAGLAAQLALCGIAEIWTSAMTRARESAHLVRSEEHTSELQSPCNLVCRLLLEKKKAPGVGVTGGLCQSLMRLPLALGD